MMAKGSSIDISQVESIIKRLRTGLQPNASPIMRSKAGYIANDKGKEPYDVPNPPDVSQVALWNEYGTETIPARPFMGRAQKDGFTRCTRLVHVRMNEGRSDMEQVAKGCGEVLAKAIKRQINNGTFKPNARSTVRQKHSSHPLIDTGNMRQSVHWGLETRDGDKIIE